MLLFASTKSNQKVPCDKKDSPVDLFILLALGLLSRFIVFHVLFLTNDLPI